MKMKMKMNNKGKSRYLATKIGRVCQRCHKKKCTEQTTKLFGWVHGSSFNKKYSMSQMHKATDEQFYEEIVKCKFYCKQCVKICHKERDSFEEQAIEVFEVFEMMKT
jgi:hypothetical protein